MTAATNTTAHASTYDAPGSTSHVPAQHLSESTLRRGIAAIGLLGIALVHLLDLPGKLSEVPYLGVAYIALIVASLLVAETLLRADSVRAWLATAGLAASVIAGFVVNRTVGMPGATDDIGNWGEPLGIASLFVEGVVLLVAVLALARRRTAHARTAHGRTA